MSAQRRSGRKRAANTRINDLPESSPTHRSQPAPKRRKVCNITALNLNATDPDISQANPAPRSRTARRPKTPDAQQDDYVDKRLVNNDTEDDEEDQELTLEDENQEMTNVAVRYLDVAPEEVGVAHAYNSEIWDEYGKNIQAFAKISGRKWTYFVTEVRIVIGRNSEPEAKDGDGKGGDAEKMHIESVHIDLGPNKMTSRQHAELFYDQDTEDWNISVHGRNGVRINERQVRKNESYKINSGDIIGIAGTQMLFQLAGQRMNIPPFFWEKMRQAQEQSENGLSSALRRHGPHTSDPPSNDMLILNDGFVPPTPPHANPDLRPKTPEFSPKQELTNSVKKRSPYKRGMMMESSEQIDYSLDVNKDVKPACSYASMITWAILSSPDESLSLHGIYEWIRERYAFYRLVPSGWQVSSSSSSKYLGIDHM